jgi:RNA recognition motif-containing protein
MSKQLYIGNLPFSANETEVRSLFAHYGPVHSATIIRDRNTGRSKGFGFVELEDHFAPVAMEEMDGTEFGGRTLRVAKARRNKPAQMAMVS